MTHRAYRCTHPLVTGTTGSRLVLRAAHRRWFSGIQTSESPSPGINLCASLAPRGLSQLCMRPISITNAFPVPKRFLR